MMSLPVSTLAVEWIEITGEEALQEMREQSPPSRWSGLKFQNSSYQVSVPLVSTLAVEWIEITMKLRKKSLEESLHPRGGVD